MNEEAETLAEEFARLVAEYKSALAASDLTTEEAWNMIAAYVEKADPISAALRPPTRFYAEPAKFHPRAGTVFERGAAPNGADLVIADCPRIKVARRIADALNAYPAEIEPC